MHAALLNAAAEAHSSAGAGPVILGVSVFGALTALLLVTYAFRSVGTRH